MAARDGACSYDLAAAVGIYCDEACCVDGFSDVFFNAASTAAYRSGEAAAAPPCRWRARVRNALRLRR